MISANSTQLISNLSPPPDWHPNESIDAFDWRILFRSGLLKCASLFAKPPRTSWVCVRACLCDFMPACVCFRIRQGVATPVSWSACGLGHCQSTSRATAVKNAKKRAVTNARKHALGYGRECDHVGVYAWRKSPCPVRVTRAETWMIDICEYVCRTESACVFCMTVFPPTNAPPDHCYSQECMLVTRHATTTACCRLQFRNTDVMSHCAFAHAVATSRFVHSCCWDHRPAIPFSHYPPHVHPHPYRPVRCTGSRGRQAA